MSGRVAEPLGSRLRLIVVTDTALARPHSVPDVVAAALRAGAPAIQLRNKGESARDLVQAGHELRALTRASGALLFVNDRIDVALVIGADGVHLGPDDLPVPAARALAPEGFLIGRSANDPEAARRAVADGADYIGCGTVFPTSTKADAGEVIGLTGLGRTAAAVGLPVIGIGGITEARAEAVAASGAAGVAVVGAVMDSTDVAETVRNLLSPWSG
ncbi:MAG: thiamine phosphate synthase [Gemmatimonadota bacterium]